MAHKHAAQLVAIQRTAQDVCGLVGHGRREVAPVARAAQRRDTATL